MKNKTKIFFKPFDSLEWNKVTEKQAKEVLIEKEYEKLEKNKVFNVGTGTFKIE